MRHGPDERWADWASWYEQAYGDVQRVMFARLMWRNLVAMLQANKAVEHHSHVNWYLRHSYAQMQAVAIRRHWEHGRERRPTIGNLLFELAEFAGVATRARYVSMLGDGQSELCWRTFAPDDGPEIKRDLVRADLQQIIDETAGARDYVNKRVAHFGKDRMEGPIGSGDWFGDINRGLDVIGNMIKKYYTLFHPGEVLAWMTPESDLAWIRMFETAWYSNDFQPVRAHDSDRSLG